VAYSVAALWPMFHAEGWHASPRPDMRFCVVRLPRDVPNFDHLLEQEVIIDACLYRCRGVERFSHSPPWQAGETIGLVVEEVL
jgi:C4-type Zn-finger protein